jgi:hypothetical protein
MVAACTDDPPLLGCEMHCPVALGTEARQDPYVAWAETTSCESSCSFRSLMIVIEQACIGGYHCVWVAPPILAS